MSEPCLDQWIALALTSIALFISMCLNVVFCILRVRERRCRTDTDDLMYPESNRRHSSVFGATQYELQENPIYGNISTNRGVPEGNFEDVCYEPMNKHHVREEIQPAEPDLNYASLDLDLTAQKRKKRRRHQHGQNQQQLQACLSHPQSQASAQIGGFLEVGSEVEATLPSRSSSPMASQHSTYLNSYQVALESEERERHWEREGERVTNLPDERARQWDVDR